MCAQLASVKRNLLPVLNQATVDVHKKKQQWGPVVAARRSSRNHGNISVLEKAKEYKKKKNLEVPTRFKGENMVWAWRCLVKGNHKRQKVAASLQGCSYISPGPKSAATGKNKRRASTDRLVMSSWT